MGGANLIETFAVKELAEVDGRVFRILAVEDMRSARLGVLANRYHHIML